MKTRCNNPNEPVYKWYGARGISVCERWQSFHLFFEDMGLKPHPKASIERINTNGNYEPSNCRWATQKEQCRNTRSNTLLTLRGKIQPIAQWAEELNIPAARISARKKLGWTDEQALTTPRDEKLLTFNGITKPMRHWAADLGIGYRTIWYRISRGWPIEKVLTIPAMTPQAAGKCGGRTKGPKYHYDHTNRSTPPNRRRQ